MWSVSKVMSFLLTASIDNGIINKSLIKPSVCLKSSSCVLTFWKYFWVLHSSLSKLAYNVSTWQPTARNIRMLQNKSFLRVNLSLPIMSPAGNWTIISRKNQTCFSTRQSGCRLLLARVRETDRTLVVISLGFHWVSLLATTTTTTG